MTDARILPGTEMALNLAAEVASSNDDIVLVNLTNALCLELAGLRIAIQQIAGHVEQGARE